MEFPEYNFEQLNETDVREEIVAPLLRYLGYRSGTKHNVIREQLLSYSKDSLGRKKKTDPILRGKADYICVADGQVHWVIEAKAPDVNLDLEAQEQSWSYANHKEVRAVYFCLVNGREFQIFQTNRGSDAEAIFKCTYQDMEGKLAVIENILSPEAILRDHPVIEVDCKMPIAPGLRSIVRIVNGSISYNKNTLGFKPFDNLIMTVKSGSVERNDAGVLEAYLECLVPYQSLQRLNEKLGLHSLCLTSDSNSEFVSVDKEKPTVFRSATSHVLPQGERILDLNTWNEVMLPMNVDVEVETTASGHLSRNTFVGIFIAKLSYLGGASVVGLEGDFKIHLS